jgi:hypothetical protein
METSDEILCQASQTKASRCEGGRVGRLGASKTRQNPWKHPMKLTSMFSASKDTEDSLSVTDEPYRNDASNSVERRRTLDGRLDGIGFCSWKKKDHPATASAKCILGFSIRLRLRLMFLTDSDHKISTSPVYRHFLVKAQRGEPVSSKHWMRASAQDVRIWC